MNSRTLPSFLALACLLAAGQPAGADIYRHTDAKGNVVFTDQPPEDAEQVELGPMNTVPGGPRLSDRPAAPAAPAPGNYTRLEITGVQAGNVLQNPQDPIVISASSDIPLQPGDSLHFIHNGKAADTGSASVYVIQAIDRGSHTFVAEIHDAQGRIRIRSEPVTIQVHRHAAPPARVRPR